MPCSAGALILLGEDSSNGNAAVIAGEDSSSSSGTLASAGPFATVFACKQEMRQKHNTVLWLPSIVLFEARQKRSGGRIMRGRRCCVPGTARGRMHSSKQFHVQVQ